jgi:hypothetical protein
MDTATLSPEHRKQLKQGGAVSPEVIAAREYRTITDKKELKALGFSHAQLRVTGLLLRPRTTSADSYRSVVTRNLCRLRQAS